MKTFNLNNDTLNAAVAQLENLCFTYYKEGLTCGRDSETCIKIGAMSAILDKLADVMGNLYLFGADFVADADELRRFVDTVVNRAEILAEVAEIESLDIIYKSINGVDHWIAKGQQTRDNFDTAKKYGVNIAVVECLRDIETLTEEEARDVYTAEELAAAEELAKREQLADDAERLENWEDLNEGGPLRISSDGNIYEVSTGERVGTWYGNAFVTFSVFAFGDSFTCDTFEEMETELIKRYNDNQGGEIIESAINFVEVDEVPTFEGSPVADKLRRMASITAKAVKTASKKAAAVLALVVCFAVGLGCMFFGCWACGLGLDAIEAQGAALPWLLRFALCVGCMFTIILDFCCWAELQIIRVFEALHAFDGFGGIYYRGEEKGLFIRPFSVIGTMISNIKNA